MTTESVVLKAEESNVFAPPGGLMVWLFIFVELFAFGMSLAVFAFQFAGDRALLAQSQSLLDIKLATLNTAVLITSGFFAALGTAYFKEDRAALSARWLRLAGVLGVIFALVKGFEYWSKAQAGYDMGYNDFFSFYWALTGFHLLHVLMGIGILLYFAGKVARKEVFADPDVSVETGVAFWHMCDLIWVVMFPMLYLIH